MLESALQILKMTGEGAVLVQRGRVAFANSDARSALGADCVGRRASELFGEVVSGVQSPFFLAQIRLGAKPYQLRIAQVGSAQVYFLRPQEELPAVLNQPFLYALRSTLMNQQMAAEQMRSEAEERRSETLLESLSVVTRSQFQILRILNNASLILSLSEGTAACMPEVFDLSSLCRSVLDALEPLVPGIRFSFSSSGESRRCADPRLIRELLMNLLSNAIRHGKGCSRIAVSLLETKQNLVLAVDDDGCGIPAEELPLVFDRYRHSFDLSKMGAGPGMGLTAARLIAQLHGGTLLLESREGSGTTLRVSLQRAEGAALQAPETGDGASFEAKDLLTGFADCLPLSCFREQYLD